MARIKPVSITLSDKTTITLRSPEPEDTQAFMDYCTELFLTSDYVATQPDEYIADFEKQKAWIDSVDSKPGRICIIAEYNGEIVGNLDFRNYDIRRRMAHRGEFGMGVLRPWRGRGVGRALLDQLLQWAMTAECRVEKIELSVMVPNIAAIKLYKSSGFKEEGRCSGQFKTEDGSYIDGITMGHWLGDR